MNYIYLKKKSDLFNKLIKHLPYLHIETFNSPMSLESKINLNPHPSDSLKSRVVRHQC